jgi:large subunit ribosomal protein L10
MKANLSKAAALFNAPVSQMARLAAALQEKKAAEAPAEAAAPEAPAPEAPAPEAPAAEASADAATTETPAEAETTE